MRGNEKRERYIYIYIRGEIEGKRLCDGIEKEKGKYRDKRERGDATSYPLILPLSNPPHLARPPSPL